MKWRVACIQTNIDFGEPEKNIKQMEWKVKETMETVQPDVLLMPELWTTGYDLTRLHDIGDENGKKSQTFFSTWARQYQVNIIGGSIAKKTNNGIYNTMYVADRSGSIIHEYSKLHLFQLMDEHLYLAAGERDSLFSLEGETCAGFICYDIRFPEWIRKHTVHGAKALFVVAEWPSSRLSHWRLLLQARAIENQCYVIACNRIGSDPNNDFPGHSLIIDPWGNIVQEGSDQEEVVSAEIDLTKVDSVRKTIPVFSDRRVEIYERDLDVEKKF